MSKKWKAEIEVSQTWIDDGFELTPDGLHEMMQQTLGYAHTDEIKVKVNGQPSEYNTENVDAGYVPEEE